MSAEKQIEANASAHNGFQTSSDYNPSITVTVERSPYRTKSLLDAYILLIPLGFFGAHHFYLRRPGWGVLYLFTFGLLGLGWLLDIFRMPNLVQNANNKDIYGETSTQKFDLLDTWVIGFCPITGLLGFHHYRLGRIGWGLLYTFTLGLFGLGWLFDNFRMPLLVKRANIEALENNPSEGKYKDQCERQEPFKGYYLDDVYVLAFNPLGILGLHHFYLKRCGWGTLYLLTVGVFGIGWLVDLVRMKRLVERKNSEICHHNQGAYYHHSSTPHYGATNLPQSQYHSENTGFQPEYQPGPHDYQTGVPNHQQCPPPNYQYGIPNQQQHGPPGMPHYQPGIPNQQHVPPGMPNCQPGVPSHQSPVNHPPPSSKDDIQLPLSVGEYPDPTNTGFPRANPPPYTQ